jgi:glycosyltransferase involved in cell wall biosynthesis
MPKVPLSVAIITLNEEDRLPSCLESLSFAEEVVVVDSGSTDRTLEIARTAGCRVFEESWKGFGLQKQSAVDKCINEWVLVIDADELIPAETAKVIMEILETPQADGYSFPRKNFFNSKWIRHGGWWPDRVVRLFRKTHGHISDEIVHESVIVSGPLAEIGNPIHHQPIRNLHDMLRKVNRYSTLGAERLSAKGGRASVSLALLKGSAAFCKGYLIRCGFLDGAEGFIIAFSHSITTCFKYLKLWEKRLSRSGH